MVASGNRLSPTGADSGDRHGGIRGRRFNKNEIFRLSEFIDTLKGAEPLCSFLPKGEGRKGAACATGSGKSRQPTKILDRIFFICYNKKQKRQNLKRLCPIYSYISITVRAMAVILLFRRKLSHKPR